MIACSAFLLLLASCSRCMGSFLHTGVQFGARLRHRGDDATAEIAKESAASSTRVPKVVYTTYPDGFDLSPWQKSVTKFAGQAVQRPHDDHAMAQSAGEIDKLLQREVGLHGAGRAFDLLRPGAYKADLWRYMVLWAYGGIYLDVSVLLSKPLEEFVDYNSSKLILVEDAYGGAYWNALMASPPKHPALLLAIKRVILNVDFKIYGENSLDVTGPTMLYRTFEEQFRQPEELHVALKLVIMDGGSSPPEVRVVRLSALQKDGAVPQSVAQDTAQFVAKKTHFSRDVLTARGDYYSKLWLARCAYCHTDAGPHCDSLRPCSKFLSSRR